MKRDKAFTLIEMAIVLVIIGLIVGGIFVGQSMMRNAQLHAVGEEYDTYVKGIKEFQDKYLALPGDMSNAAGIWPTATNGDGNGTIGSNDAQDGVTFTHTTEWWGAWQQLALAGFIPGNFTGAQGSGGAQEADIGVNVPASRLTGAGWTILYYLYPANGSNAASSLWPDNYGHILTFGGFAAGKYTAGPVLTPAEAQLIDQKLDDGMPDTGNIRAWRTNSCTASAVVPSQTSETYNIAASSPSCSLVFLLGF